VIKIVCSLLTGAVLTDSVTHNLQNSRYFWCAVWNTKSWFKKQKPTRKLNHANSILEYFEYSCQMSSSSQCNTIKGFRTRSSATTERQRVSYTSLSRLTQWSCTSL